MSSTLDSPLNSPLPEEVPQEPIVTKLTTLVHTDSYGKFGIEPLESGFATTLGNALRRVLLSSVEGAAITLVKIGGVLHEFSTIPGVNEDATELILNLKELAIKVYRRDGDAGEIRTLRIDRRGEGEVTGADIETPEDVEVVNPEVHVATLADENSSLDMELIVETGKGYVLPENLETYKHVIGTIPVGAAFTPVQKVSYASESTRVGGRTDLERLIIEIWTNATVTPSEALSRAACILQDHLSLFAGISQEGVGHLRRDLLRGSHGDLQTPDARIEELDFSMRTYNCLKKDNILTIRDLMALTEEQMLKIRNFGSKSLNEVREKLAQYGLAIEHGKLPEILPDPDLEEEDEEPADTDDETSDDS